MLQVNGDGVWTYANPFSLSATSRDEPVAKFDGTWTNGVADGSGTATYEDSCTYIGAYANGVRAGHGTLSFISGAKYVGNFADLPNGEGWMHYENGNVYNGEVCDPCSCCVRPVMCLCCAD